jgi:hypothetical protein
MSTTSSTEVEIQMGVEINEIEKELTFQFEYIPCSKGSRDFYGQQNEPDTEDRMEFLAALDEDGEEIDVSNRDIECAREQAFEYLYNG